MGTNIDGLTIDAAVMADARRQLGQAGRKLQHLEAASRTAEYDGAGNRRLLAEAVANIHAALARLEHAAAAAESDEAQS